MLWEYSLIALLVGIVSMSLAFDRLITPLGRVIFMLLAGVMFPVVGYGLLKVDFTYAGSQNIIPYTWIPAGESWIFYLFIGFGALLIVVCMFYVVLLVLGMVKGTTENNPLTGGSGDDSTTLNWDVV